MLRRTAPAVLATLVCAIGLFAASAATWIHATVETTLQPITVDVAGSDAAPAVTALGLVAGAAAVALTLAGRVLRTIVGAVVSLAGVGAIFAVLSVTADPENASRGAVGTQTGAVGTGGEFVLTVSPWLALAAAVGLILCGLWLVLVARNARKKSGQRYDREALAGNKAASADEKTVTTEHSDDIDAWDAFTRGEDPTRGPRQRE